MADKNVSEAAWTLITSFQEANQAVAEYLVSAQERNRKLAKRFFTEVIEVLKANQAAAQGLVATQESGGKHACLAAGVRPADQEAARSPPDPGARTSGVHARCPAHSAGCLSESAWMAETVTRQGLEQVQQTAEQMQQAISETHERPGMHAISRSL